MAGHKAIKRRCKRCGKRRTVASMWDKHEGVVVCDDSPNTYPLCWRCSYAMMVRSAAWAEYNTLVSNGCVILGRA